VQNFGDQEGNGDSTEGVEVFGTDVRNKVLEWGAGRGENDM
jgi:hypothetical protein